MTTKGNRVELETNLVENLVIDVQNYKQLNTVHDKNQTVISTSIQLPTVKSNYSDIEYQSIIEQYQKSHDTTFAVAMLFDRC